MTSASRSDLATTASPGQVALGPADGHTRFIAALKGGGGSSGKCSSPAASATTKSVENT